MWVLIQSDRCPNKKGRLGHRHTRRDGHVRTREKTAICKPRREAWGGITLRTPGSSASGAERK